MKNLILILLSTSVLISCNQDKTIINAGIGGNTTLDLLNRINEDVINNNPDMVIVMVGTNDMLNSKKMITYNNYEQNLEKIIKTFKQKKIKVVLCTPPTVDTTYLFERHQRSSYTQPPNIKLDSINSIIKSLSKKEDVSLIDINSKFKNMSLPRHNFDMYIQNVKNSGVRDGVHPTKKGYTLIAETIFIFLRDNDLLDPNIKIICFGDSITYGTRVKGEGTSEGDTYPAILKRKIKETFANTVYSK